LLFTAWLHVNFRFTVKHEKTEDENEDEDEDKDEGCRLIPTTHSAAADYLLFGRGFALYVAAGARIDSSGGGTVWFRLQGFIVQSTKGFGHVHKDADCREEYFP
jgi:hypothetical protein